MAGTSAPEALAGVVEKTADPQKRLNKALDVARKQYSKRVSAAKAERDTAIVSAYVQFTQK